MLNLATGASSKPLMLFSYTLPTYYVNSPLAVNPKSGVVYFNYSSSTAPNTLTVEAIDPATLTVIQSAPVSGAPYFPMVVSPDGARLLFESAGRPPKSIYVLDVSTQLISSVPRPVASWHRETAPST